MLKTLPIPQYMLNSYYIIHMKSIYSEKEKLNNSHRIKNALRFKARLGTYLPLIHTHIHYIKIFF